MSTFKYLAQIAAKISTYIPGRIEKLKNERDRLENELEIIMCKDFTASGSRRASVIVERLQQINDSLGNNAKD